MKKKLLSLALAFIMVLCLTPTLAFAATNTPISSIDLTDLNLGDGWAGKTVSDVKADIAGYSGYASQNLSYVFSMFADFNDPNQEFLPDTYSFTAGNTYMIQLVLQADDGFYFDNDKEVGSADVNYLGTADPVPMVTSIGDRFDKDEDEGVETIYKALDASPDQMIYIALIYSIEAKVHVHEKGTHHEAVAPTCEAGGTIEYWDCTGCDKMLNADCEEIDDIADGDPLGHSFDTENWQTGETEHWHAATCGHTEEKDSVGNHDDGDNDHKCDVCGYVMSECADEDEDHKCDICGNDMTECADEDGDHKCDICGKVLAECADEDEDHKCDICGKDLTECADEDEDHKCDICGKDLTECVDENKDHKCDICGKDLTECVDENKDNKCDICGKDLANPNTGDESNLALFACLFLFSLIGIGATVVIHKKRVA